MPAVESIWQYNEVTIATMGISVNIFIIHDNNNKQYLQLGFPGQLYFQEQQMGSYLGHVDLLG